MIPVIKEATPQSMSDSQRKPKHWKSVHIAADIGSREQLTTLLKTEKMYVYQNLFFIHTKCTKI